MNGNVDEVMRAVLFFYEKISQAQKAQNAYKQTKTKKAAFLCTLFIYLFIYLFTNIYTGQRHFNNIYNKIKL